MIGTQYLRAYMHGYFMDIRLYRKVLRNGVVVGGGCLLVD
jgi:hypothetical protein